MANLIAVLVLINTYLDGISVHDRHKLTPVVSMRSHIVIPLSPDVIMQRNNNGYRTVPD